MPLRRRKQDIVTTLDIWKAIAKYGLPTALLVPLLYVVVVEVRHIQRDILTEQRAMVAEQGNLARGILKVADRAGEQQMLSEKILLVLRVQCVNTAKTSVDRNQCLREQ